MQSVHGSKAQGPLSQLALQGEAEKKSNLHSVTVSLFMALMTEKIVMLLLPCLYLTDTFIGVNT